MNILYLDFETSPIVGWSWVAYEADLFHIVRDVQIISVAWSWEGDDEVFALALPDFKGYRPGVLNIDDKKLVKSFIPIFEKADMVVAHNGNGFDFKLWRTRLVVHGFPPYPELRELDTKQWAKKFRFTNNKMDTVARQLGEARKMETDKNLHYKCLELGLPDKWQEMVEYNKQDILPLKGIAHRMAPFIRNLPNANLYQETVMGCTNPLCRSQHMIRRGKKKLSGGGFRQAYQCYDCGHYASGPIVRQPVTLK